MQGDTASWDVRRISSIYSFLTSDAGGFLLGAESAVLGTLGDVQPGPGKATAALLLCAFLAQTAAVKVCHFPCGNLH